MNRHGRITAYIHLDAVERNFQNLKSNLKEKTQMIAVIKADGYGHGAVPIAQKIEQEEYIWGFAVATFLEAKELRDAGIVKPVLILGYSFEEDYEEMIRRNIRPTIFTMEMAQAVSGAARRTGICAPVHLAVDTGMSRIGVPDTKDGIAFAKESNTMDGIRIEGVFTHFARADERDKEFTHIQMKRFTEFCDLR